MLVARAARRRPPRRARAAGRAAAAEPPARRLRLRVRRARDARRQRRSRRLPRAISLARIARTHVRMRSCRWRRALAAALAASAHSLRHSSCEPILVACAPLASRVPQWSSLRTIALYLFQLFAQLYSYSGILYNVYMYNETIKKTRVFIIVLW